MRIAQGRVLAGLSGIVLAGCATTAAVDSERFEEYRQAFSALQASAEEALAFEREWAYDNYMRALQAGGHESPADVILEFPSEEGDAFAWSLPGRPIFLTLEDSASGLSRVNGLFSDYTALLVGLAGGQSDDAARIEALAEALNENSRSASQALGLEVDAEQTAFFATAAAAAARVYLENRRADDLRTVLEENQQAVDAFARLGAELAELSAIGVKEEYQDATDAWIERVVNAPSSRRAQLVEQQLELNQRTIAQLRGLRALHDGYLEVAGTHADLARTVGSEAPAGIRTIADRAREVQDLYKRLREAGSEDAGSSEEQGLGTMGQEWQE